MFLRYVVSIVIANSIITVNCNIKDQLAKRHISSRIELLKTAKDSFPKALEYGLHIGRSYYATSPKQFSKAIETDFEDDVKYEQMVTNLRRTAPQLDLMLEEFETENAYDFKLAKLFDDLREKLLAINAEMKQVISDGDHDKIEEAFTKNFRKVEQLFGNVKQRFRTQVNEEIKIAKDTLSSLK